MSDKTNETQTLIAIGLLLIMILVAWYLLRDDVALLVAYIRRGYLMAISLFTSKFDGILAWLATASTDPTVPAAQRLSWDNVKVVSVVVGDYFRWPVVAYFCYGIWWCMYKTPRRKYRTVYNVDSFIARQAEVWPVIKPLINLKPSALSNRIPGSAVPAQLPMFAESLAPEEWIAWARIPVTNGVPDKEALRQAFAKQLGPKWEGMKGLKDYHRALIAAFALKGAQKRKESDDLLGAIATCWDPKGGLRLTPDVRARVMKVLNDDGLMSPVLAVAAKHAHRTPVLVAILKWARDQGGVLAPAQFVWLRGEDRALWYPLNNLGRRSYHAEAAGAMAHFMAEQAAGRALPMPRVDNAIPVITDYLANNTPTIPTLEGGPRDTARLKMG